LENWEHKQSYIANLAFAIFIYFDIFLCIFAFQNNIPLGHLYQTKACQLEWNCVDWLFCAKGGNFVTNTIHTRIQNISAFGFRMPIETFSPYKKTCMPPFLWSLLFTYENKGASNGGNIFLVNHKRLNYDACDPCGKKQLNEMKSRCWQITETKSNLFQRVVFTDNYNYHRERRLCI